MAAGNLPLYAFNRGLISPLALARTDLKRQALSAERQTNWMPRMLGSMMLRPGTAYLGQTNGNAQAKFIPFVFSNTDTALLEVTDSVFRPWVSEAPVTRVAVSTTVTNGTFTTDLTGWTSADEVGASSTWATGSYMRLTGTGFNYAKRYQALTIASADQFKEHGLRIVVAQEAVTLRVGTTEGNDDVINERTLGEGTHSFAFTPAATPIYVELSNNVNVNALVKSVVIEAAGVLTLPAPWALSAISGNLLRWDQSGDVVYVACDGYEPRKILRNQGSDNPRSWSIEYYRPKDGPFNIENVGPTTLTPSGLTGVITLTASHPLFRSGHVGALFRIASSGAQAVSSSVSGTTQFTNAVKVEGTGSSRSLAITISGTWAGTVVLQRSVGAIGDWSDVSGESWTANTSTRYLDGFDNSTIYYRLGFDTAYTSGTATVALNFGSGSITGICRITAVTDSTHASANVQTLPGDTGVLQGLGATTASSDWWEGQWSGVQGFPSAVGLYEGRLWWAGKDAVVGSVSDAYESFDEITNSGDSGPINRVIGSGPVDTIGWILPLQRLVLGTQGAEKSARSSSFDSPLTPTDFLLKDACTQGAALIPPVKIDFDGIFVEKSLRRIYRLSYQPNFFMMDYSGKDLTNFVPDIAIAEEGTLLSPGGFKTISVQRQPDTRLHGALNDGTVRVLIVDPLEDEEAWIKVQTAASLAGAGSVEDVVILPDKIEDAVYYVIKRTINGATVRYLERWAREDECWGATITKCMDAHVSGTNSPAGATISGLSHLIGESVVCWADGVDQGGPYTVSAGGTITLPAAVTDWVAGLAYTAQFKSAKLAYAAQLGTALAQPKKVNKLGFVLANTHAQGIKYGPDFTRLVSLPSIVGGKPVATNAIFSAFDQQAFMFPGEWNTDARLCLQAASPRPCTVLAAIISMETREAA